MIDKGGVHTCLEQTQYSRICRAEACHILEFREYKRCGLFVIIARQNRDYNNDEGADIPDQEKTR